MHVCDYMSMDVVVSMLLQTLHIESNMQDEDSPKDDWCVDASDIGCLSRCLPALGFLSLNNVTKDLHTVAELIQLMPGLTKLSVGGDVFKDEAAGLVAKLTSPRALDSSGCLRDDVCRAAGTTCPYAPRHATCYGLPQPEL
jgi:hypothetical protein